MATSHKQVSRAACLVVAGLGALLMAPKCGTNLVVPAEDRTPPEASLLVLRGGKIERVPESGLRLTLRPGEQLIVYVSGKDEDGGIRKVSLVETASSTCAEGVAGEERREEVEHIETNEAKPGEVGNTTLYTNLEMTGAIACAPGLEPRAKRYSAYGIAENHQGATTTTPTLIVDVDLTPSPTGAP